MTSTAIGQYYPVKSPVHSMDPRVKLVATMAFIALLFAASNIWGYILTALFLGGVIALSQVPPLFMFKGLKGILFILLFTVTLNMFFTPGETVWAVLGPLKVTREGVWVAATMGARLVLLVVGSSVLTLTTSPIELTDAIEYLLKPFKRLGVPAHEIAMMMTIALRFIPTLLSEVDKIMKAQTARGADFDTGGLIKKAKGMIPLLVPLFISAFRRADDLALAMEARCYRGDVNRTRMKSLKLTRKDVFAAGVLAVFGACLLLTNII